MTILAHIQPDRVAEIPLGITTEFSSAASSPRKSSLKKRYKLQSAARHILPENKRLSACCRVPSAAANFIVLQYSEDQQNSRFRNLCKCDSDWLCPVCAVAVTERRRYELHQAVTAAKKRGFVPVHVVYTMQHHKGQRLAELLHVLIGAYDGVNSGRGGVAMRSKFGFYGSIRSLEITEGSKAFDNGWHPHLHVMVFVAVDVVANLGGEEKYAAALQSALWERWEAALMNRGGAALQDFGVRVKMGDTYTADYIAKYGHEPREKTWSIEQEMSKANVKVGRENGRTPFALLEDAANGDAAAAALFREFAIAIKGRSQLHWSKGLKDILEVDVMDDAEAIEWGADYLDKLLIDKPTWNIVLKKELRGDIVAALAESKGNGWLVALMVNLATDTSGAHPVRPHHTDKQVIF